MRIKKRFVGIRDYKAHWLPGTLTGYRWGTRSPGRPLTSTRGGLTPSNYFCSLGCCCRGCSEILSHKAWAGQEAEGWNAVTEINGLYLKYLFFPFFLWGIGCVINMWRSCNKNSCHLSNAYSAPSRMLGLWDACGDSLRGKGGLCPKRNSDGGARGLILSLDLEHSLEGQWRWSRFQGCWPCFYHIVFTPHQLFSNLFPRKVKPYLC